MFVLREGISEKHVYNATQERAVRVEMPIKYRIVSDEKVWKTVEQPRPKKNSSRDTVTITLPCLLIPRLHEVFLSF